MRRQMKFNCWFSRIMVLIALIIAKSFLKRFEFRICNYWWDCLNSPMSKAGPFIYKVTCILFVARRNNSWCLFNYPCFDPTNQFQGYVSNHNLFDFFCVVMRGSVCCVFACHDEWWCRKVFVWPGCCSLVRVSVKWCCAERVAKCCALLSRVDAGGAGFYWVVLNGDEWRWVFLHNAGRCAEMHDVAGSDRDERFDSGGLDFALGSGVVINDVGDNIRWWVVLDNARKLCKARNIPLVILVS